MTHILIVDADPILVLALREELELCGCTVSSAANGAEAMEQADGQIPNPMLLEMTAPGGDGLHCCRVLRRHPRLHNVPVIFMSACTELADNLAAYEAETARPNGNVLQTFGLRLHLDKALVECGARKVHLTPMECKVLHFLWLHLDQIVSSRRILREVLLYPEGVGDPTAVRWYIKNLRRKIELDPTHPVRLRTLAHHGYMLVSDVTAC